MYRIVQTTTRVYLERPPALRHTHTMKRPLTPTLLETPLKRLKVTAPVAPSRKRAGDDMQRPAKRRFTAHRRVDAMENEIDALRAELRASRAREEVAASVMAGQAARIRQLEFLLSNKQHMHKYIMAY